MSRFVHPLDSQFNINGVPLDGAKREFFEPGLLVKKDTFSDEGLTIPNSNPVIANASGTFPEIWLNGGYDVTLKDKNDKAINGPLKVSSFVTGNGSDSIETKTIATMTAIAGLTAGLSIVKTAERATGKFGGGTYDVVLTSGVTPNTFDIIVGVADASISFVLRKAEKTAFTSQWAVLDGTIDALPGVQAATDYIISQGGGDVIIEGDALLNGVGSGDTVLNGILIPFASFAQDKQVRIIGGPIGGRLLAGTNNMMLVRGANVGTQCVNLEFEGNGKTGVWAMGCVPEDRDQVTTTVSQSHCKMIRCQVINCLEGFVMQPGPTVSGSDSGAFYPVIYACDFNLTNRGTHFRGASAAAIAVGGADGVSAAANRVTRANVGMSTFLRGNVGVDLEYSTEGTFLGNNFEFMNVGTSPVATPSAYHLGAKSENNFIIGGSEEACDFGINNNSNFTNNIIIGFPLSGVNNNDGVMPQLTSDTLLINEATGSASSVQVVLKNSSFVRLVADTAGDGTKDAGIFTNDVERINFFNGLTTIKNKISMGVVVAEVNSGNAINFVATNLSVGAGNLDDIVGGSDGDMIYLRSSAGGIIRDSIGNLRLASTFTMNSADDRITLMNDGTNWVELSRSDNA